MDAEERLIELLVKTAYEQGITEGHALLWDERISELAEEAGASDQQARQVLRRLTEAYLFDQPHGQRVYRATQRLYQEYERFDRPAAYRQNQIRRWILEQVGELDAKAKAGGLIQFRPDENDPYPPAEQYIAARVLAYENCLEMPDEGKPAWFTVKFGTQGYEALHDEQLMRRLFPVSVTDDEEAQIPVAPDVLQSVITSCEQLLETLGWRQAQVELTRGDKEYRDKPG